MSPVKEVYAQYSDYFMAGDCFTDEVVSWFYRKKVESLIKDGKYCGMWQIHGLGYVLGTRIYSVYPDYGGRTVRNDLNRLVIPTPKGAEMW